MENWVRSPANDSSLGIVRDVPDQGVGFPTACLTVGENGSVVSVKDIRNCLLTNILVHLRLAGLGLQHHIQRVYVVLRLDVHGVVVDENAVLTSDSISGQFLIVEWEMRQIF